MRQRHLFNRVFSEEGPEALRQKWIEEVSRKPKEAYEKLNDPFLDFPSLFVLKDDVKEIEELSIRNRIALLHIEKVLNLNLTAPPILDLPMSDLETYDNHVQCYSWMIESGSATLLNNDFLYVIDHACTHLYHFYKEGHMAQLVELLFHRYRNSAQHHYLLQLLYDSPQCEWLLYVARYLYASPKERRFAQRILHFIPNVRSTSPEVAIETIEDWYEEHHQYLLFTGETNDTNHDPVPFVIHYGAKYLGKAIHCQTGQYISPLSHQEFDKAQSFAQLSLDVQERLSTTSAHYRKENRSKWREWIKQPLSAHLDEHRIYRPCCH
ncbi:hypothetical protein GCM10011391_17760 [Pullulanibacillus camelliae]|uniref:Uncharacterized protein n=1 Tax=Pullulanibacillus camelliae TaxID=1707096 RepID=A0A8J2VSP1_9BACL|nr:hypothetical protein [Pullulanibacillus camelliae]GGE39420.1 hypothetical protein GCM10011391_17760 [Pullulanibacillus camelliae]